MAQFKIDPTCPAAHQTGDVSGSLKEIIGAVRQDAAPCIDYSSIQGKLDSMLNARSDAAWNESDHPRAANGQFGSGGGSGSKSPSTEKGSLLGTKIESPKFSSKPGDKLPEWNDFDRRLKNIDEVKEFLRYTSQEYDQLVEASEKLPGMYNKLMDKNIGEIRELQAKTKDLPKKEQDAAMEKLQAAHAAENAKLKEKYGEPPTKRQLKFAKAARDNYAKLLAKAEKAESGK